jgi:hypothetical protein
MRGGSSSWKGVLFHFGSHEDCVRQQAEEDRVNAERAEARYREHVRRSQHDIPEYGSMACDDQEYRM